MAVKMRSVLLLFSCVSLCSVSCNLVKRQARVFGGVGARLGQYPYVVLILNRKPNSRLCTGSIISTTWVLTAAHCVRPEFQKFTTIFAGLVKVAKPLPKSLQYVQVKTAIKHPDYVTFNHTNHQHLGSFNDLGLLETEKPFILNEFVNTVPITSVLPTFYQANKCKAMGFGVTEEGYSNELRSIPLKKLFRCTEAPDHGLNSQYPSQDYVCSTAGAGKYVYSGDSGSPMICDGVLVAVCFWVKYVSEDLDMIILHTATANFVDWITSYVPDVTVCTNKMCTK